MSGSRVGGRIEAYAIPGAPLVDQNGLITPAWYRLIVSLISRTGGTAGRVTPQEVEPQTVLMGLLAETAQETPGRLFLDVGTSVGQDAGGGVSLVLGDRAENTTSVLLLDGAPVQSGSSLGFPSDPGYCPAPSMAPSPGLTPAPEADTIAVGASPYDYTPGHAGALIVQGGTVSVVAISRNGTTFITTGATAGMFPLEANDTARITYTVAPTVNFLRRAS